MSAFARRVASLSGASPGDIERLAGGDLSEVLLVRRRHADPVVAKGGPASAVEAAMLRALRGAGVPAPTVVGEYEGALLIEHIDNDGVFTAGAWTEIGAALRRLHDNVGDHYGWPTDHAFGSVTIFNQPAQDWPSFWGERRLIATASTLDRPWRERVDRLASRLADLLPAAPPPALLHGDFWTGNILVKEGRLAAFIDPACYHGDCEVDAAMLGLFGAIPEPFRHGYGSVDAGWKERLPIYQLFPALVHLRLFGGSYASMVDRLLYAIGA